MTKRVSTDGWREKCPLLDVLIDKPSARDVKHRLDQIPAMLSSMGSFA